MNEQDILNSVTLQRIETAVAKLTGKVDTLTEAVGWEKLDEKGEPIGTGLTGRVMRVENNVKAKVTAFDGMRKYATGATAGMGLMMVAIWWLISDKIQEMLK